MAHVLVVGATGMLREVVLHLAHHGHQVTAIARRAQGIALLKAAAGEFRGAVHPLAVDYRDDHALRTGLANAISQRGPIVLAVCWIHSDAPEALGTIASVLAEPKPGISAPDQAELIHIVGSAGPHHPLDDCDDSLVDGSLPMNVRYRRVVLGFVKDGGRSRWLTNDEIARGVIRALTSAGHTTTVGTIDPWEDHPSA